MQVSKNFKLKKTPDYATISGMSTIRTLRRVRRSMFRPLAVAGQGGAMNLLAIPLALVTLALFAVAGLAYYEYGQSEQYKNDVDQQIAAAVSKAEAETSEKKDKAFAEKEKSPYVVWTGPAAYGSLKIQYPRTWSAYVDAPTTLTGGRPVNGYFAPNQVPSINDQTNTFALRVYIVQQAYDGIVKQYQGKQKSGTVTIQPYQSPNVPGIVGVRIDGEVQAKKQGSMIVLPFRDKTLELWTESNEFKDDFNNIILPNFSLVP